MTTENERKPHFGIIAGINGMNYCIPLTLAKHLNWACFSCLFQKQNKLGTLLLRILIFHNIGMRIL